MRINLKRKEIATWPCATALIGAVAGCGGGGSRTNPPLDPTLTQVAPPIAGQSELLFKANRAVPGVASGFKLFLANLDGSNISYIPLSNGVRNPVWFPERRELLYVGFGTANNRANAGKTASMSPPRPGIHRVNRDGTNDREIVPSSAAGDRLAVSPDGQQFASSARYIIVANGDGTKRRTLSEGTDPAWSPDGQRLAYSFVSSAALGQIQADIYVMGADGSNPTRLTNSPEFETRPHWSSDGRRIVFQSLVGTGTAQKPEIYVVNADGSNQTKLRDDRVNDFELR